MLTVVFLLLSCTLVVIKVVLLGGLLATVHCMPEKFLATEENLLLCKDFPGNDGSLLECCAVSVKSNRLK